MAMAFLEVLLVALAVIDLHGHTTRAGEKAFLEQLMSTQKVVHKISRGFNCNILGAVRARHHK